MKFQKSHRVLCASHYGDAFLLPAMCDLHVNKHKAQIVKIMVGNEVDDSILEKIWKSLTSWGRRVFSASADAIRQIAWTAVAAVKDIPVFLIKMKHAAESMINATGSTLLSALKVISKGSKQLWDYIMELFGVSKITPEEKLTTGQQEIGTFQTLIDKFGETATRIFHWLGKHVTNIVTSLYRVIQLAISNVSDIVATFVESYNSIGTYISEESTKIIEKNYELVFFTLSFSTQMPYYQNQGNTIGGEYMKRYGSHFGREISEIGKMIHMTPDVAKLDDMYENDYVNELTKLIRVSDKIVSWLADRFRWLASFLRGVAQFAADAFVGFYQRVATVITESMDVFFAMFMDSNVNMPQMQMTEMIDYAQKLSKEKFVDPDNRRKLLEVIDSTKTIISNYDVAMSSSTHANIRSGVKLEDSTMVLKNCGKIMAQAIQGYELDEELGNQITKTLFGKSMQEFVTELQTVYTILISEIWLAFESIDTESEEIDDAELARRMKKYVGNYMENIDQQSWWRTLFYGETKEIPKEDIVADPETKRKIKIWMQQQILFEHVAKTKVNSVYDINPLTDAFTKKVEQLNKEIQDIDNQIENETIRLNEKSNYIDANFDAIQIAASLTLAVEHKPGYTMVEKNSIEFIEDVKSISKNSIEATIISLLKDKKQLVFELEVLEKKEQTVSQRINSRTFGWMWIILGAVGILGIVMGGYTFYQSYWDVQETTISAIRSEAPAGVTQLVETYYKMWQDSTMETYFPWKIQTPNIEALRLQGEIFINNLQNGLGTIESISTEQYLRFLSPYTNYLSNVVANENDEAIQKVGYQLLNTVSDMSTQDFTSVEEKTTYVTNLLRFVRGVHFEFRHRQKSLEIGRLVLSMGKGLKATFLSLWAAGPWGEWSTSAITPAGLWSAAASGAPAATMTVLRKMMEAGIGMVVGFIGIATMGTYLLIEPFVYMYEGGSKITFTRMLLAVPFALGPYLDVIFNPLQELSEAVTAARLGQWATFITVALILIPGYGPLILLKKVFDAVAGRLKKTPQQIVRKGDEFNLEESRSKAKQNSNLLEMEQVTKFKDEFSSQVTKNQILLKGKKEKKSKVPPKRFKLTLAKRKAPIQTCIICKNVSTFECTHCKDGRSYCDHVCLVLDWNPKDQVHTQILE